MRDEPPYGLDEPQPGTEAGAARARVRAPAIFLLVVNALNLLAGFYLLANSIFIKQGGADVQSAMDAQWQQMSPEQRDVFEQQGWDEQTFFTAAANVFLGWGGVTALTGAIALFGSMRMLSLRSYGLALTGAILTAIPCTTPCCLVGQVAGLWAMVVLLNAEVRRAFQ